MAAEHGHRHGHAHGRDAHVALHGEDGRAVLAAVEAASDVGVSREERVRTASRSTWVSVVVNIVLTVLQLVIGFSARSQALVADAIHSLSDLLSDGIVLVANRYSQGDPDDDHPYGHQRFETIGTMLLGALMLSVGVGMLWQAVERLRDPGSVPAVAPIALITAVATVIAKEGLFRYLLSEGRRVKSSMLVANAWHSRSDAWSSVVVAAGIGGNLLGIRLLDPIAAAVVGLMVLRMGWSFTWNALQDLADRGADTEEVEAIRQTILQTPGVLGEHDLRTRKLGDLLAVDVHLEIDGDWTVREGHAVASAVMDRLHARHRVLTVMTHVDPWHGPPASPTTGQAAHG